MTSQQLLRRGLLAARCRAQHKQPASTSRTYATQEPDPQLNGYPELPNVSRQYSPPLGWQDQLLRKNFGDTLHEREELYSMWAPDIAPLAPSTALKHFSIAAGGIITAGLVIKYVLLPDPPAVRREYPYDGLVKELGGLEQNKARVEVVDTEE